MNYINLCDINLNNLTMIGKGHMGEIYKYNQNQNEERVIKVYKIVKEGQKKYMEDIIQGIALNELRILVKCSRIRAEGISDGFVQIYDFAKCPTMDIRYLLEFCSLDFVEYINMMGNTVKTWLNIMFQIRYNILVMHHSINIAHADLDINNIMFRKTGHTTAQNNYYKYVINDEEYLVPDVGYQMVIIDFGNSVDISGDAIGRGKKKKLIRDDYKFFFGNGKFDTLFRLGDLQEIIYQTYNVKDIVATLKDNNEMNVVEKSFEIAKRKMQNSGGNDGGDGGEDGGEDGGGEKLLRKVKFELSRAIGRSVKLYKLFDPELKNVYKVDRPNGVVQEFDKLLKEGRLFNKCDNKCHIIKEYKLKY